jgi:hypothetical protein
MNTDKVNKTQKLKGHIMNTDNKRFSSLINGHHRSELTIDQVRVNELVLLMIDWMNPVHIQPELDRVNQTIEELEVGGKASMFDSLGKVVYTVVRTKDDLSEPIKVEIMDIKKHVYTASEALKTFCMKTFGATANAIERVELLYHIQEQQEDLQKEVSKKERKLELGKMSFAQIESALNLVPNQINERLAEFGYKITKS